MKKRIYSADHLPPPDATCGARTRAGTPCKRRDLYANGRCRLHGGLSTGPKSEAGREAARRNLERARAALARPEHADTRSRRNSKANRRRPLAWLERLLDRGIGQSPSKSP